MAHEDEGWKTVTHKNTKPENPNNTIIAKNRDETNTKYDHQDWKQIIIKSKNNNTLKINNSKPNISVSEKKYNSGKNIQSQQVNAKKIEQYADGDDITINLKLTHNFTSQMQKIRQQKGLTQKQLANECNLPETVIRDYENGSAVPNQQDISKMNKALGAILKNK